MEPMFEPSPKGQPEDGPPGQIPYQHAPREPWLDPRPYSRQPRDRYWVHILLFSLAFLTTTIAGLNLARGFERNVTFADFDDWFGYTTAWHHPALLIKGLPFSVALLAILMAHEMGHYVSAQYHRVDATLPFFLPVPWLFGTMGAFIRIRSHIRTRRALFDIGVSGPVAGFVMLVVVLAIGVSLSKIVPGAAGNGEIVFGTPLLLQYMFRVKYPAVASANILLHPVARAAWVGMLTTALNLLPIGQLDGGHILYAFLGERTRIISRVSVGAMILFGAYQLYSTHLHAGGNWLVWATALFFLALRHPTLYDSQPLDGHRTWVGIGALGIFLLCFMANPVGTPF